jgi:hypothetical protein
MFDVIGCVSRVLPSVGTFCSLIGWLDWKFQSEKSCIFSAKVIPCWKVSLHRVLSPLVRLWFHLFHVMSLIWHVINLSGLANRSVGGTALVQDPGLASHMPHGFVLLFW